MRSLPRFLFVFVFLLPGLAAVQAQSVPVPSAPQLGADSYVLVDFRTGTTLVDEDASRQVEPASITKLMTSYVVFNELAQGKLTLDEMVAISERAWRTPGSRMFIEVNTQVKLEDLLLGMIVQSGNDASVALAEHVAGTEAAFADLMNHYADQLGLQETHYENATGLPAEGHLTSARDVAVLAHAIINEFPDYYAWYSQKSYEYNDINQHNRNTLLWRDPAVDGLKTGHTEAAGYCLVSSARRGNMRLISVVMGTESEKARADDSQALLNYGFRFFESHELFATGSTVESVPVWKGAAETVDIGLNQAVEVVIPRGSYDTLQAQMDIESVLTAPIAAGQAVGTLRVSLNGESLAAVPLVTQQTVAAGSLWRRLSDSVRMMFADDDSSETATVAPEAQTDG